MDEMGLLRVGAGTGGCFMMIGSAEGSEVPWSFSLMSFIAMENSNLSIFPSLFISARALGVTVKQSYHCAVTYSTVDFKGVWVCASHHISASTEAGSPDWRKNFLACSPTKRTSKGRNIEKQGSWDFNSWRKWCHVGITKSLRWHESHCGQWSTGSYLFVACTWDIAHGWGQTVKLLVMFLPLLWRDRPYTWATWKERKGAKVKWWENVKDCESSVPLLLLLTEYWHNHQWRVADEVYCLLSFVFIALDAVFLSF